MAFHIDPLGAGVSPCHSSSCPLGEHLHYSTEEEAVGAFTAGLLRLAEAVEEHRVETSVKQATAASLVAGLCGADGLYAPPVSPLVSEKAFDSAPEGFEFVGGGVEYNVYRVGGFVYKVPNREFVEGKWCAAEAKSMGIIVGEQQEVYEGLDHDALDRAGVEYALTEYFTVEDATGLPVPVVVQPYYSPEEWEEWDLLGEDPALASALSTATLVDDLYPENVLRFGVTGRVVLIDCLGVKL